MPDPCSLPGCDELAASGYAGCTDPDCFAFEVAGFGWVSAKELTAGAGLVPTADVVCNDRFGFFAEYAGQPDMLRRGLAWIEANPRESHMNTPPDTIHKVLDLSTAHVPEAFRKPGEGFETHEWIVAYPIEYGWLLWVPGADDVNVEESPPEVRAIYDYARQRDCTYVLFDRDADENPNLPSWDW